MLHQVGLNLFMTKLHKSPVSKLSLLQLLKFMTWEKGLFKMPRFKMPHFKTEVFKMVASWQQKPEGWCFFTKIYQFP